MLYSYGCGDLRSLPAGCAADFNGIAGETVMNIVLCRLLSRTIKPVKMQCFQIYAVALDGIV